MRMLAFASTAALALGAASPLLAQENQYPQPPMQMPDMAAMHCGGGMGDMMHGMAGMMYRMPGMRADSMMRDTMRNMMPFMMRSMMRDMMSMMGPPTPGMILDYKDQLKLTPDQVTRLTALQKQAETTCREHMRLGMEAHQAANRLLEADKPDFMAFTAKLKEAAGHMVEAHVAMAKAAVAARGDLTTAQRQTVKDLVQQMSNKR